ncbi:MAG: hypothetical protein KJ955_06495 [Nanoarchaeota archaeon]|nr:hypothetical protein [Nanoarchaeota archaeon]
MKKPLILLLALCLLSSFVSAEFSSQSAYNWLSSKADSDGAYNDNVVATAWAVLALGKAGISSQAEHSLEWIFSEQSSAYCFPSSPCRTKDTAMALLAMDSLQRLDNITWVQDALKSMIVPSSLSGKWFIEVSTDNSGTCKLSWEINNQTRDKTVVVNKGKFPECGDSYFLDVESSCLSSSIIRQPGTAIDVDCTGVDGSDVVITLLYRSGNKYYIVSSTSANKAEVIINNGCFGNGPGDVSCKKESSLYAAWAAKKTDDSSVNVKVYLMDAYSESGVEDNALLYLATGEARYLEELKRIQKTDGSFERSVMKTALAVLALNQDAAYSDIASKAVEWLKTKQKADGSLGEVTETAAALYAAFNEPVDVPPSDYVPPEICNDDGLCDYEAGEDSENCPEDCPSDEEPLPDTYGDDCEVNNLCETDFEETTENCPDDCTCGDGICDDYEDAEGSCDEDCVSSDADSTVDADQMQDEPSGSSAMTWVIIILIILIVVAGGIFAVKKFGGAAKPKQKPGSPGYSFPRPTGMPPVSPTKVPPMKQMTTRSAFKPAAKSKDTELEKSLEEARKLLGE